MMNHRLKCDALGCDYEEATHMPESLDDLRAMIGRPCQKCGASLMTEEDAQAAWNGILTIREMQKALSGLGVELAEDRGQEGIRISVNPRASSLNIKVRRP